MEMSECQNRINFTSVIIKLPNEYIQVTSVRYSPLQEKGFLSTDYEIVLIKTATAVLICIRNKFIIVCVPDINMAAT